MKNALLKIALWYVSFLALFIAMKVVFILSHGDVYATVTAKDYLDVISHGLLMDCATAGYLTVIPTLLTIAREWTTWPGIRVIAHIYCVIVALIIGLAAVADTALYGYWDFKLDMTPVFYFLSSPSAAMASVNGGYLFWCIIGWIVVSFVIWMLLHEGVMRVHSRPSRDVKTRCARTGVLILVLGALFIAIRGGLTVSTMNLSRAYFSQNMRLNHAAVNPLFSFLYSATHQNDEAERFRYMEPSEAERLVASISAPADKAPTLQARIARPDIYIILLESFSSHVMPSLGGDAVATGVDSIAESALSFTRHFASGFRTDRAIPAILGGFPSMPTLSAMKDVAKSEKLPGLPTALVAEGYDATYYYGGDADFTNMRAYLRSSGIERIISDTDFPLSARMSKWGVPDHLLVERATRDIASCPSEHPQFTVIQTSSSHEPFEVPYSNPRFKSDERANAIAYTDSCVTAFVNNLRHSPRWDKSVVVLVADHYGTYPAHTDDPLKRHHVPLVITGGALDNRGVIDTPTAQTDIPALLLGMLGLDHSHFNFSHDPLSGSAFFSNPNFAALVTPTDTIIYDFNADKAIKERKNGDSKLVKAYLQKLYNRFDKL